MTRFSVRRAAFAAATTAVLLAGLTATAGATSGRSETVGGVSQTWTDYKTAGGKPGPAIAALKTVWIDCRVEGFKVADGNAWWYKVGSKPWDGKYYVSADAFYNNGHSSGSLLHTPFVDKKVPLC